MDIKIVCGSSELIIFLDVQNNVNMVESIITNPINIRL